MQTAARAHPEQVAAREAAHRAELLRALGAALLTPPPGSAGPCEALGLPVQTGVEHTQVFVLSAPPHAAIHLGPEGQLGGEGLDRIGGFWRALGLHAPEDADHLGVLLLLYAELLQAEAGAGQERVRAQMRLARTALFHEHLWSWAPGYLAAVEGQQLASISAWARLTGQALQAELTELGPAAVLPLALRAALPGLEPTDAFDETLDALVAPIRSGTVLTHRDLLACAGHAGVGLRRGERRYALRAMLLQDSHGTLAWLAGHAEHWSARHLAAVRTTNDACAWWATRAARTARTLTALAAAAGPRE